MEKNKKYPEHSGCKNANWKGGKSKRICEICGKIFYAYVDNKHKGRFCSIKCRGVGYNGKGNPSYKTGKITKNCKWCGKEFESYAYNLSKFCSRKCNTMHTLKYCVKKHDTDIELIIEGWLIKSNIKYEKQKPIGNFTVVDFFIYPDWCLYVDGDYWHSKPERKAKDTEIDKKLIGLGYYPQRIKGSNVKRNKEFFNVGIR